MTKLLLPETFDGWMRWIERRMSVQERRGQWTEDDIVALAGDGGGADFPPGGTTGQVLGKASDADDDVKWLNPSGAQGPPGPQGPAGATGPTGPKGDPGVAGPAGATGPAGSQGPKGDTGSQGPAGPTGPQGAAGSGITMRGSVATSSALPPTGNQQGDAFIVQADDSLWVWDGTKWVSGGSIQGPPGATGATGAQGPAGAQGPKGDTGATGPKGDAGATGAAGPTGPAGPTGAQGPKGDTGATGATGPAGAGVPSGGNPGDVVGKNAQGTTAWIPGWLERGSAASGANMNTMNQPGAWNLPAPMANGPVTASYPATVMIDSGNGQDIIQTVRSQTDPTIAFVRSSQNGGSTWTNWVMSGQPQVGFAPAFVRVGRSTTYSVTNSGWGSVGTFDQGVLETLGTAITFTDPRLTVSVDGIYQWEATFVWGSTPAGSGNHSKNCAATINDTLTTRGQNNIQYASGVWPTGRFTTSGTIQLRAGDFVRLAFSQSSAATVTVNPELFSLLRVG